MIYTLTNAQVANGDGNGGVVSPTRYGVEGIFQTDVSGGATATLMGRASPTAPWTTIYSTTTAEAKIVAVLEDMKVVISGYTTGTISAWLNTPEKC